MNPEEPKVLSHMKAMVQKTRGSKKEQAKKRWKYLPSAARGLIPFIVDGRKREVEDDFFKN